MLLAVVSWLCLLSCSFALLCNNQVTVDRFLAAPEPFRGVVVLQPPGCAGGSGALNCPYSAIIGDNEQVPPQPNLDSDDDNNDVGRFLVWPRDTGSPYISFDLGSARTVTTVGIEFLNYPAEGFSLPNLQLYATDRITRISPGDGASTIDFVFLNNSGLSQDDYKVTNIKVYFPQTMSQYFLFRWNYTRVYNLSFFLVSEIDFCNDPQPPAPIEFQDPQSDNTVIVPSFEDLMTMSTVVLNCTVSISGLFEWQWRQNGSLISNSAKLCVFTADGTRTSKLQLTQLRVSDAASYTCEVRHEGNTAAYQSRTQTLEFPVIVDLAEQVTGYLDEGQVVLTCEVYGFLRSTNPPTWLGRDGNTIDPSRPSKYIVTGSTGSQSALLISSGASVPGQRSTLTIRQLEEGDAGSYTCMVDGNSSTVQLVVVTSTSTPPPLTHSTTSTAAELSCPQTIQTAAIASFISSLITALIVVGISVAIHVGVCFSKKSHSNKTGQQASEVVVYEAVDDRIGTAMNMKENKAYEMTNVQV